MGTGGVDLDRLDAAMNVIEAHLGPLHPIVRQEIEYHVLHPYLANEAPKEGEVPTAATLRQTKDCLTGFLRAVDFWREEDSVETRKRVRNATRVLWLNSNANIPLLNAWFPFYKIEAITEGEEAPLEFLLNSWEYTTEYLSGVLDEAYSLAKEFFSELKNSYASHWPQEKPFEDLVVSLSAHWRNEKGHPPSLSRNRSEDTYGGEFYELIRELAYVLDIPTNSIENENAALGRRIARALQSVKS